MVSNERYCTPLDVLAKELCKRMPKEEVRKLLYEMGGISKGSIGVKESCVFVDKELLKKKLREAKEKQHD